MTGGAGGHRPGGAGFRADVEGLRAVAVLLVLVYHSGAPLGGGFAGVDVFFVVSGFVITAQLVRELEQGKQFSLLTFYGRRAKRLLPAASLVVVVTAVAAWFLAPAAQWRTIAGDLIGSAAYVVNWVFAGRAVDYLAEDVDPSPMQHYWSLAVEEQFYIVWPLIILALIWVSRRLRGTAIPSRLLLSAGLTLVVLLPSFLWAMYLTAAAPERAFFVTTTRMWELALGALVALGAHQWQRLPRSLAALLAWAGLTAVLVGAVVQDGTTPWPGPGAAVPVLGTAAVIIGGFAAGRGGPLVLLGWRPLVWIGGLSYSLYLWHWALLVIVGWHFGDLDTATGLLVVTLSVLPAWLSFRFVERPIRHAPRLNSSPGTALSVGLNMSLAGVIAGLLLAVAALNAAGGTTGGQQVGDPEDTQQGTTQEGPQTGDPEDEGPENGEPGDGEPGDGDPEDMEPGDGEPDQGTAPPEPPGAEAAQEPPVYEVLTPSPLQATEDRPDHYDRGCQIEASESTPVRCEAGDPDSDLTVAVVGDSKVLQWVSAIEHLAQDEGWHVVSYTKSGCSASLGTVYDDDGLLYAECLEWSEAVLEELREDPPDVYVTSGRRELAGPDFDSADAAGMTQGYADYWNEVADLGSTVVAISDTPGPRLGDQPAYQCVADHPDSAVEDCSWPYEEPVSSQVLRDAAEEVPGAEFIDMNPWVCPAGTCPSVFRNIVTYRQGSHVTMTYVLFLTPDLGAQLVPLVEDATE